MLEKRAQQRTPLITCWFLSSLNVLFAAWFLLTAWLTLWPEDGVTMFLCTSVIMYKTIRHYIPEDSSTLHHLENGHFEDRDREGLKSRTGSGTSPIRGVKPSNFASSSSLRLNSSGVVFSHVEMLCK
jgi:hypothetical protein